MLSQEPWSLRDIVGEWHMGKEMPATWHQGWHPINGVWALPGILPHLATVLAKGKGVGDHRALVVDFWDQDLFGKRLLWAALPEAWKLTGAFPITQHTYVHRLREWLLAQNVINCIDQLALMSNHPRAAMLQ